MKRGARIATLLCAGLVLLQPQTVSAQPRLYVTNYAPRTLSVLNLDGDLVERVLNVGAVPIGLAVSNDGTLILAVSSGTDTVSIVPADEQLPVRSVQVGRAPYGVALSPDATVAYVANGNPGPTPGSVSVIDVDDASVMATIAAGRSPTGVALSPRRNRLYVTNLDSNNVSVIDTVTLTEVTKIPVGAPFAIAASPDGERMYVTRFSGAAVAVIATASNTVIGGIPVGAQPNSVATNPITGVIYVGNGAGHSISVINPTTLTGISLTVEGQPKAVAVLPDAETLAVAVSGPDRIHLLDTGSLGLLRSIPINDPGAIAAQPGATATAGASPTITRTPTITARISVTPTPTITPTSSVAATPTWTVRPVCTGDCDGDNEVTVNEIIVGVNIALGTLAPDRCTAIDASHDGEVTVDELVVAVTHALQGC